MSKESVKEKILSLFKKYKNFILYGVIGVTGVTIDYIGFTILTRKFETDVLIANLISVTMGIINNFVWNTFVNFKKKDKIFLRFISFFLVGIFGLGLSSGILRLFVDILGFDPLLIKFLSIIVVVITQYFLNKNISFKNFRLKRKIDE